MDEEFVEPQMIKHQKQKKSGGFESMQLIPSVYQAIKKKGYNIPTPIQRKTIPLIMAGHDIVAASKTGSGKTAAFVIPLMNKLYEHCTIVGIRGLIIVPTRELALQTASVIKHFTKLSNILYSLMVGGHGFEGQFESLAQNPDILIATPGRLMQHLLEGRLSLSRVEMVIFDEADMLFEMGLVDQLKNILQYLPKTRQSLVFSATIPEQLSGFAQVGLKDYIYVKLDKEFSLPDSMMVHFLLVANDHKLGALINLLGRIGLTEPIIIFASTKYMVDMVTYALEKFGLTAVNIYGKMDSRDRQEQLQQFKNNSVKILVVTDLASRGIDIPFVCNVIQYDYPSQPKVFIHRAGRTARAGRPGSVYSLIAPDEVFFIAETMLFAGRKLVNAGEQDDVSKAFYGTVPIECYQNYQVKIEFLLKEDPEFSKLSDISSKANQRFCKLRGKASRASKKGLAGLNLKLPHLMYADEAKVDNDTQAFIDAIRTYKPQQSYLEIKKSQQMKQNNKQNGDKFLQAVQEMKRVEILSKQQQALRKQAKQLNENKKKNQQINDDENINNDDDDYQNSKMEEFNEKDEFDDVLLIDQVQPKQQHPDKKSHKIDYRHPTQYMSSQPDYQRRNEFDDLNKIQNDDVNAFIAEDMEGVRNQQKKNIWDPIKKRYIYAKKNESGQIIKDHDDIKTKDDKGKQAFSKWKKRNTMTIQNVGEREDINMTGRAKSMFQRRQMRGQGYYFDDMKKSSKATNELKNQSQMLKSKKIKKNLQLKNMEKSKRTKVESKIRQFKKGFKQDQKQKRKNR